MLLQVTAPGILGGIVKGLKVGKADHSADSTRTPKSTFNQLEVIFLKSPHSGSSPSVDHQEEAVELDIGPLNCQILYIFLKNFFPLLNSFWLLWSTDDIEIDEPQPVASTSFDDPKNIKKGILLYICFTL